MSLFDDRAVYKSVGNSSPQTDLLKTGGAQTRSFPYENLIHAANPSAIGDLLILLGLRRNR